MADGSVMKALANRDVRPDVVHSFFAGDQKTTHGGNSPMPPKNRGLLIPIHQSRSSGITLRNPPFPPFPPKWAILADKKPIPSPGWLVERASEAFTGMLHYPHDRTFKTGFEIHVACTAPLLSITSRMLPVPSLRTALVRLPFLSWYRELSGRFYEAFKSSSKPRSRSADRISSTWLCVKPPSGRSWKLAWSVRLFSLAYFEMTFV